MTVRALGARFILLCLCVPTSSALAAPAAALAPVTSRPALTRGGMPLAVASSRAAGVVFPAPSRQADEAGAPASRPRSWWGWVLLGRLHPMVVHFPIALLTVAALIELLHVVRRKPVPSEAGTYCLAFGVVGALASVGLGTMNAGHQTVTGEAALALERHQVMGWISMITSTAALGTGQLARRARQFRTVAVYVGLVLAAGAVVGATGHLGGGLVYGEDYLTGVLPWNQTAAREMARPTTPSPVAPVTAAVLPMGRSAPAALATPSPAPALAVRPGPAAPLPTPAHDTVGAPVAEALAAEAQAADAVDFSLDVMPILKRTCVECHGPDKVKARLRMDSVEALQKGGKSGALLKPGDAENSLIMRRVLGLDGEDQMPLDKDPLTEKQIDTLRRWIAAGATYPPAGSQ